MAYLASELISDAYFLANIRARDYETVSASDTSLGLRLLNVCLDFKSSNTKMIPYFQRFTLNLVPDQEEYFIPGLVDIELFTFNINTLRFPVLERSRKEYFGTARALNVSSLPYEYRAERELNGTRIYLYFKPVDAYVAELSGKFALTDVILTTDMETVYDKYYIEYLKYCLAHLLCFEFDCEFTPQKFEKLKEYELSVMDVSPPDMSFRKISTFEQGKAINYAQVNLGGGWTVR